MRCKIVHESAGRLRVHLSVNRMTLEQADLLEYSLRAVEGVRDVKVYDRTQDAVICYRGDRASVVRALAAFSYEEARTRDLVPEHTSRALNREYQDRLAGTILRRCLSKLFLPMQVRAVISVCRATGYIRSGLQALAQRKLSVAVLVQCLGVLATAVWAAVMITIVFQIIKHTIGLRVSAEEELKGLDITEHGLPSAYGGFAFNYDDTPAGPAVPSGSVPVGTAIPVEHAPAAADPVPAGGVKLTRIDILCKMERFDALKRAMFDIGITGMTAANVMGCGEQRGRSEGYYRGAKVEATMLPSIQVSIVVSKLPVSLVIDTARKVLYTGNIGDGKIFVYNVENVVKIRTGEEGYDALQDAGEQDR